MSSSNGPQYVASDPSKEEIKLVLPDAPRGQITLSNFLEYSFDSDFLTPSDAFSFTIGDAYLPDDVRQALQPEARVQLILNGAVQCTGKIDKITFSASKDQGSHWRIEGRDAIACLLEARADPTLQFKDGQSLLDVLKALFAPFGWGSDSSFAADNAANRDVRAPGARGKQKTSEARGFSRRAIKDYKIHTMRPYPDEGVYAFAKRLADREGLAIWVSADAKQIIVSTPDFDSAPNTYLIRSKRGDTNVLEGSVTLDGTDQPSALVLDSHAPNGEFGPGRYKTVYVNGAVKVANYTGDPPWQGYINAGAHVLPAQEFPPANVITIPQHRIIYKHDDESTTQDQLDAFARRTLAEIQRKSLTVSYVVEGHGQQTPDGYIVWDVDSVTNVADDGAGLTEPMYILGRTFMKSRNSGTTTELRLIRLGTISLNQSQGPSQAGGGGSKITTYTNKVAARLIQNAGPDVIGNIGPGGFGFIGPPTAASAGVVNGTPGTPGTIDTSAGGINGTTHVPGSTSTDFQSTESS